MDETRRLGVLVETQNGAKEMPSELRRLTFSESEVADAVASYAARTGMAVPGGELRVIHPGPEPERNFRLGFGGREILLEAEFLGAALIMLCIEQNIPIPRRAGRSLKVREGELSLYLHLQERSNEPAAALPDYYDYDFFG